MSTACILAAGHVDKDDYVKVYDAVTGRQQAAHRLAYRTKHGHMPPLVRHTCDNRRCRNPEHLLSGTQLDNMRDMKERGRLGKRLGADNNQAVLSDAQITSVRTRYTGARGELTAFAKEFGVSRTSISNYVRGVYR